MSFRIASIHHKKYWGIMAMLCLMVIVRNVLCFSFPIYAYLIVGVILCAICSKKEIVAFICSMAPYEMILQNGYMVLIASIFLIIKNKKCRVYNFLPVLAMILWEILHMFYGNTSILNISRQMMMIIALGIVLTVEPLDYSDGLQIKSFSMMTIFSSAITFLVFKIIYGYSIFSGDRLGGDTYDIVENFNGILNPNTGSMLCVLSICGLCILLKHQRKKSGIYILIIVLSVFVLLYQSKAAILSLIVVAFVMLYTTNKTMVISIIKSVPIIVAGIVLLITVFRAAFEGIVTRFSAIDLTSGRLSIFGFYHEYLFDDVKHLLFGTGLTSYQTTIMDELTDIQLLNSGAATYVKGKLTLVVSHNSIQEIVVTWGLLGLVLVGWLLFCYVRHKKMRRDFVNYLPFLFVVLYSLQGQWFVATIVPLCLIFCLTCLEYEIKEESQKVSEPRPESYIIINKRIEGII